MSELSIKLRIGNREYPMRIRAEDEERSNECNGDQRTSEWIGHDR